MSFWQRKIDFSFRGWLVASLFLAAIVITWTAILGSSAKKAPLRCRAGFIAQGARCCAPGQTVAEGYCVGAPLRCPEPYRRDLNGCVLTPTRITVDASSVSLGPTDWDSTELTRKVTYTVRTFSMDQAEVDYDRYAGCVKAGLCPDLAAPVEPGIPVTGLSAKEAARFCSFAGGRLPTVAEWMVAAAGNEARRFPWGPHGLVCRRASYGLSSGPCAVGGTRPELPGMRWEGRTPSGFVDLAGNVAEWVVDEDGQPSLRGGSFRSKTASELKTWAISSPHNMDDVGFRCSYDGPRSTRN